MLFADRGCDQAGVQETVEATGLTKPTLYHFFGSKNGLLETLFQEYAVALDRNVQEAAAYQGDLTNTLDRIAAAYIEFSIHEPLAYRFELALYFAPRNNPARAVAVNHYVRRQTIIEGVFRQAAQAIATCAGGAVATACRLWVP